MKVSELLRLACIYAEQDRLEFIDAMSSSTSEEDIEIVEQEKQFLKELVQYRKKRWGRSKTEKLFDNTTTKTVPEIVKDYENNGGQYEEFGLPPR
jgi:acetyl/propionyl-CoA carboxylase alpha subunit